MASAPWMLDRVGVAVRSGRLPLVSGLVAGFFSALVPSSFAVYPGGAGLVGGIAAACAGAAVLAPVVVMFFMAATVGGEDDDRITEAHFLSGVRAARFRGGAAVAALAQWAVFAVSAAIAGAVTGLGDGLRTGNPMGTLDKVWAPLAALVVVSVYTAVLTAGISMNANGRLRSFVGSFGPLALFFILLAFGAGSPVRLMAKLLPAAPIWSFLPPEVTGRFTLSMSVAESAVVVCVWTLVGVLGLLRCLHRGGVPPQA
jgi:hypothetical protein